MSKKMREKTFKEVTGGIPKGLAKTLYVPQHGDKYYIPCLDDDRCCWNEWAGDDEEVELLELGLVCRTGQEATDLAEVLLYTLEDNRVYKPKMHRFYYYPLLNKDLVEIEGWRCTEFDVSNLFYGLVCPTKDKAYELAKTLFKTLWNYRMNGSDKHEDE